MSIAKNFRDLDFVGAVQLLNQAIPINAPLRLSVITPAGGPTPRANVIS
ncbi:hypothetical protein AM1_6137 [Acaryochloris marina MBIC11017]|uniref:Uncharacterized protein n=1 Tax=Acaryochloris marina (strain MBIC 11017) TaxID=329726 RepID=B0C4T1_ACAM1|nr:hypothetical protein AM1_6137 [Acaryochloris marina MBIC11017]